MAKQRFNQARMCLVPAPSPPTGFSVVANGTDQIDLTWDAVPGVDGYRIFYGTTNVFASASLTATKAANATSHSITGLSPSTLYYVWIISFIGFDVSTVATGSDTTDAGGFSFAAGLVHYYSFDNAGDRGNDSSSGNRDLTDGGASYDTGIDGSAARYSTGYLSWSDSTISYLNQTTHSVSLWVKRSDLSLSGNVPISLFVSGGPNAGFYIDTNDSNLGVSVGNSAPVTFTPGGGGINYDVWTHIVITFSWDGTDTTVTAYVNGTLVGSQLVNGLQVGDVGGASGATLYVVSDSSSTAYNGFVDEIAIWSGRLLDGTDASDLYNSGTGLFL